jgi:hypothetical protein
MDHDEWSAAEDRGMNDESHGGTVTPTDEAAVSKVGEEPGQAVEWSAGQPTASANTTPEIRGHPDPAVIDTQATLDCTKVSDSKSFGIDETGIAIVEPAPRRVWELRPPNRDEAIVPIVPRDGGGHHVWLLKGVLLAALGLGWIGGSNSYRFFDLNRPELTGKAALDAVVERIIHAESDGDPNAKNKRSSVTGTGQFLDGTWLEMIRAHRPDLIEGRGEKDILDLRQDPELAREITTRFVEQNAAMLTKRGLPVTPGTLYLAHFAGAGGAVAILSGPPDADAASLMASADATGQMTREKIVAANPFLGTFTVADLKSWADRKMRNPG